uniref:Uncharacterized protein n=1 Tax=Triticum urartu TaxID=4572 RepID=A0A8R7P2Y8_TRIUA
MQVSFIRERELESVVLKQGYLKCVFDKSNVRFSCHPGILYKICKITALQHGTEGWKS